MAEPSQDKLYANTLQTIGAVSKLPVVRVDREAFLRKHFGDSEHLDVILAQGPQAVYSVESLRKKANSLIKNSAAKTSAVSFASGLPGNPAVMVAAGGADVAQYFGFAINLAQEIAYLFGEDDLFDGGAELSEAAKMRVIAYLGSHVRCGRRCSAGFQHLQRASSGRAGRRGSCEGPRLSSANSAGWRPARAGKRRPHA